VEQPYSLAFFNVYREGIRGGETNGKTINDIGRIKALKSALVKLTEDDYEIFLYDYPDEAL